MKCSRCGFISRRDLDYCPYCGQKVEKENDSLKKTIKVGRLFEIKTKTLIYLILINLLAVAFIVDYFFDFKYEFGLGAFIILVICILAFEGTQAKKSAVMFAEKIDFWLTTLLLLCCFFLRIKGVFDIRNIMIAYVLPGYIIVSTLALFILLLTLGTKNIKPLWTGALILYHLVIALVLLIFVLVSRHRFVVSGYNATDIIPYVIMCEQGQPLGLPYLFEEIVTIIALTTSVLYFFNFNFILFSHVFREVRSAYGKRD